MNIDKELLVTCPDECGQIAVACSLRMILDNQSFICDACGCEFQGTIYPTWLSVALHNRLDQTDLKLFQDMQVLYAYLYAGGTCPSNDFLESLLLSNPQYWQLFPVNNLPVGSIVKLIATDAHFAQSFDYSTLSNSNWLELLGLEPSFAFKCPWTEVSRYVVESKKALPSALHQNSEKIFANSGLGTDKKFSSSAAEEKYNIFSPIVFANKMKWMEHLNWDAFRIEDIFSAFQVDPKLLNYYPFTNENVDSFNWSQYDTTNWIQAINVIPRHSPLAKIHSLRYGNDVEAILKDNPQWAKYCDWSKISADDWLHMVLDSSPWASHCQWNIFNSSQWLSILKNKPEHASHCSWDVFKFPEWLELFKFDISYARHCDWSRFTSRNWVKILQLYPEFSAHCNWKTIDSDDWKKILTNDLIDRTGYDTKNGTITDGWESTFRYEDLRHPEYLAIFSLLKATRVAEALNRFPNLESSYLDWEMLSGEEWLRCLAEDARLASKCTAKHWRKILEFINGLPPEKKHSVKNVNPKCWEHRLEILEAANCKEITCLSAEKFYALVDFMDWEWDNHFSWAALDKNSVLELAAKHPEFLERYGFERISNEEMTQLLVSSPEFVDYCLEKIQGNDDVAKQIMKIFNHDILARLFTVHPELYSKFKSHFSLNLKDRIGFKYYGIEQLRSKVAFFRLFVTQIVMFLLGWIFLFFGECGYKAFSGEHPKEARTAMFVYVGFALAWSLVQAKLHEYCGKGILSRFLGVTQGLFGVILFGYSFFLTNLTRPGYLVAIVIYGVYMLFMLYAHHHCAGQAARLGATAKEARMNTLLKTVLVLLNLVLLVVLSKLCHPSQSTSCLKLSQTLKEQRIPFKSASTYFYRRAMAADKEFSGLARRIDELISCDEFDQAADLLEAILERYPTYDEAPAIRDKIDTARKKFIEKKTKEAIRCFDIGKMEDAFQAAELADAQNPYISMILGITMLAQEKHKAADYHAAEKALLFAAQNGVARAMFELGKLHDPLKNALHDSVENAEKWYKEAFDHDVYEAAFHLAEMLDETGRPSEAFTWMSKAAEHGVAPALQRLAEMYLAGHGYEQEIDMAISLYEGLANDGDTAAQLALGKIYCDKAFPQFDYEKAAKWYLQAAEADNAEAQLALARMYEGGLGVEKDVKAAEKWYRQAAQNGSAPARKWVAKFEERLREEEKRKAKLAANVKKAIETWAEALDSGSDSKHRLAVKLANEADPDNSNIQAMLAYEYFNGKGVAKDVNRAVELAKKAAEADEPIGYYILAKYYEGFSPSSSTGLESSKEYILTCLYYEKAAEGGLVSAQCKVAELCIWGRGFDDGKTRLGDIKKKLYKSKKFGQASDNPNVTNIHNYEKAVYWLNKAYEAGSLEAAETLAEIYTVGYGEPDEPNCGHQGINCYGSIRRDTAKALEIIQWIEIQEPQRAKKLRARIK